MPASTRSPPHCWSTTSPASWVPDGIHREARRPRGAGVVAFDGHELAIDESVRVVTGAAEGETATFTGPLESLVRLLSGRLKPEYTPAGVDVTGNVTLDQLREVFPGY